ncbi:MAG: GcrA family cell cycle regulator [Hasllibacter sp.]
MSWTDERVETLKRMWGEGQSASTIAKELGGVTRNAVIGKVHRLGLSNRQQGAAPAPAAPEAPKPAPKASVPATTPEYEEPATRSAEPPRTTLTKIIPAGQPLPPQPSANEIPEEALEKVRAVEKGAARLDLMELTERTCKWPIGDPATPAFWFCGLPAQAGKPYCEAHVSVAFQPASSRRDRRR